MTWIGIVCASLLASLQARRPDAAPTPPVRPNPGDVAIRIPVLDEHGPVKAKDLQWCGVLTEHSDPCLPVDHAFGPTPDWASTGWGQDPRQSESAVVSALSAVQPTSGSGEDAGITLRVSQRTTQSSSEVELELWVRTRPHYEGPTRVAHLAWNGRLAPQCELPALRLEDAPVLASGRVLDARGKPLAWARIEIASYPDLASALGNRSSIGARDLAYAETLPDGTFEIRGLVAEPELLLRARRDVTMEFAWATVARGATNVTLAAQADACLIRVPQPIHVLWSAAEKRAIESRPDDAVETGVREHVLLIARDSTDPRLRFPFLLNPFGSEWSASLPPGKYDLVARLADGQELARPEALVVPSEPSTSSTHAPELVVNAGTLFELYGFELVIQGTEGELPCAIVRRAWCHDQPLGVGSSLKGTLFLHTRAEAEVDIEAEGYEPMRALLRAGQSLLTLMKRDSPPR